MRVTIAQIARVCHEVNREWCLYQGDESQAPWEFAPDWQKESCLAGVGFVLENVTAGPSASHESWMRHKVADGWIYGPTKDPEAKTHPCMVPFEDLPPEQQFKDRLFRTVVLSMIEND